MHFAGIGLEKKFVNTTLTIGTKLFPVNLTGSFLMTKEIAKIMISQKYGRIITSFFSCWIKRWNWKSGLWCFKRWSYCIN